MEDLTADLVNTLNTGALILNYSGHAGYNMLANERIWDNRGFANREDCELLTNTDKYPLVISDELPIGLFYLSRALDRSKKHQLSQYRRGAYPSGRSWGRGRDYAHRHDHHRRPAYLNNAIFEEIFTNDKRIIGDALLQARLTLLANTARNTRRSATPSCCSAIRPQA